MEIRVLKDKNEIYILELHGSFDLYSSEQFKKLVMRLIEHKIERLILDLKDVDIVNSSGIGALVNIASTIKKLNLVLAIANVRGLVRKAMNVTRLSRLLPITSTLKEAVESIRAGIR